MSKIATDKAIKFIDSWLELRYNNLEIPGFTVAIQQKGKVLFEKSYGFANTAKKEKLTPRHIFRIASHSKTFTATAVMQLQEQGKIRIDDHVADYLTWLKKHTDKRWQKVTIRQLLSHSAGVLRDGVDADYWQLERPFPDSSQLRTEVLGSKLVLENNTKMKYSNYGYSLLGLLIEVVSKISYEEYVTQNIIKPLKLNDTGSDYTPSIEDRLVTAYSRRDYKQDRVPISKNIPTNSMAAATGFYATARDLCAYFSAHVVGSKKLLSDESKKEMQRLQWEVESIDDKPGRYGLGLQLDSVGKRKTLGHSGGFPGTVTVSFCDPDDELVVTVLVNSYAPVGLIAKGIMNILDYFKEHSENAAAIRKTEKFEGRFMCIWGISEFVSFGKKILDIYPDSWAPFEGATELKVVDEDTLKITKTSGYSSSGEFVKFTFTDRTATKISHSGTTLWPEKEYLEMMKKVKVLEVPKNA